MTFARIAWIVAPVALFGCHAPLQNRPPTPVTFEAEPGSRWVIESTDGRGSCNLPCTLVAPFDSRLHLQVRHVDPPHAENRLDLEAVENIARVPLDGRPLRVEVSDRSSPGLLIGLLSGGAGAAAVGGVLWGLSSGGGGGAPDANIAAGIGGIGGAVLVGTGAVLMLAGLIAGGDRRSVEFSRASRR